MIINIILCKHWIILLNYFTLLFVLSGQQIIHNPIISDKEFNPIDYILIPQDPTALVKISSSNSITLNPESNFLKFFMNLIYLLNLYFFSMMNQINFFFF